MSTPPPPAFKLALICGGPSPERGISLNSARSVMDHLHGLPIHVIPIYVDYKRNFYQISQAQLYSNTPADFDFKLAKTSNYLDSSALQLLLKEVNLVFPLIHGAFGEDGELQSLLEKWDIPFVGHSSTSCKEMFRKSQAHRLLEKNGFAVLPQLVLSTLDNHLEQNVELFFKQHSLTHAVVKPSLGGSSIGVLSVNQPDKAFNHAKKIFDSNLCNEVIIEPFCKGKEFTLVILENFLDEPVGLIPTEVELQDPVNEIFDFRKKYLPTNRVAYHTPPRFSEEIATRICEQGKVLFKLFNMHDFVRLDGWLMDDGSLYFTDINPISGLEQNSFLFQQAAVVGMSHQEVLEYILRNACRRYGISYPIQPKKEEQEKKPVYVLFGSHNAERQVSLMSGSNVWLKLRHSFKYNPVPFFIDPHKTIWELPYSYPLHHTVEEIYTNCLNTSKKRQWDTLIEKIQSKLKINKSLPQIPDSFSYEGFLKKAQCAKAFVFIALHGGMGENGELQRDLEALEIPFNGSNANVSSLCMDKYLTGKCIAEQADPDLSSLPKKKIGLAFLKNLKFEEVESYWEECCRELDSQKLIIKPCNDGCSAGIVLLQSAENFYQYSRFLNKQSSFIPPFTFENQSNPIEMPTSSIEYYLLEPYIETDEITISENKFQYTPKTGWIELTVGVFEKEGKIHSLNPSITIATGSILSLEEKFQGGTGINLTPPPEDIISPVMNQKIKKNIEKAAKFLGIQNYARFDIFFNCLTEKIIFIEANTLPALTPSTVIYHQGLAEEKPLSPFHLLENIIDEKL